MRVKVLRDQQAKEQKTMAARYRVAVVKVKEIERAVKQGLELMGGIERYVRPGNHVLIKVNMFSQGKAEDGNVTHPGVVLAVARLCHACGAQVTVAERLPKYDYILQGYEAIEEVAELVAIEDLERDLIALPGSRSLTCQIPWASLIDTCDVFINIPGLRTHALTKFSNAMKNLMGLLPADTTRYVHEFGLDGAICDLNYYRPSDLVITEAIYTLEGNFPSEGSPVKTDLITVADNVVAADLVGAKILGLDPQEVFYLQEAIRRGMGPSSLDEVELLGDDLGALLEDVQIAPAPRDPERYAGPFKLRIKNACPSCRQALAGGLLAVSHIPELAQMQDVTIFAGHQDEEPVVKEDEKVLAYGNCAYRYRHLGHYEPGCPPLCYQVRKGLEALQTRTISPSLCSIAWREEPIETVLPIAARAGYLGLETWGPHLERYVEKHGDLALLATQLREQGLKVPMISAYFDLADDLEGSLATARRYVEYAQALDAPLIRAFTGGGDSSEASVMTWRAVVSGLRKVCSLGLDQSIGFALETHAGHLHDTAESTLRLIRQTDMPNLCVNLDVCNLYNAGEDPVRALKRLLPWVRILHLKNGIHSDGQWEPTPMAEGEMNYETFLQALAKSNYGGYASVEWFGEDPEAAAFGELAYLRHILGDKLKTGKSE
ncbi:MAG: DUF362 domain-containing protein [Chloroflexota bacterium]|nr:DUF362 domain-containing protein [Chloroflexota bacterium]